MSRLWALHAKHWTFLQREPPFFFRILFEKDFSQFFTIFSNGYNCPPTFNPADFVIGVLASAPGSEKASQRAALRLCDLFAVSEASQRVEMLVNLEMSMAESGEFQPKDELFLKPFWLLTVYWLIYRNFLNVLRDPSVQTLRILQKIVSKYYFFRFVIRFN